MTCLRSQCYWQRQDPICFLAFFGWSCHFNTLSVLIGWGTQRKSLLQFTRSVYGEMQDKKMWCALAQGSQADFQELRHAFTIILPKAAVGSTFPRMSRIGGVGWGWGIQCVRVCYTSLLHHREAVIKDVTFSLQDSIILLSNLQPLF